MNCRKRLWTRSGLRDSRQDFDQLSVPATRTGAQFPDASVIRGINCQGDGGLLSSSRRVRKRGGRSPCYGVKTMKASLLYRISSILLLLFAVGHTVGFQHVDPGWRVDSLVHAMKTTHFNANGSD